MASLPQNPSESFKRRNAHLYHPYRAPTCQPRALDDHSQARIPPSNQSSPTGKRLRQSSKQLNKTEQAFLTYLRTQNSQSKIHVQAITFVLANGVRYTPDFVAFDQRSAWEVKGFMRDDAAVKIKVAASKYPELDWCLVWRKKGVWQFQYIKAVVSPGD